MVQAVENWADVTGVVEHVGPAPGREGFVTAAIRVTGVKNVGELPNFFTDAVGQVVDVHVPVPSADEAGLRPGRNVSCRVRKADAATAFAHPDRLAAGPA